MAILFEMTEEFREGLLESGIIEEGTMQEIADIKKSTVKDYKALMKEAKGYVADGEYSKALNNYKKAKDKLALIEKQAKSVSDPEFIDYLKRVLLWSLVFNPIIAGPIGITTVENAKKNFNKWIKKQKELINTHIDDVNDLKKNK